MSESFLSAALWYAGRWGWPVLPCQPGDVAPRTGHGFYDASVDPQVIRRWWRECPNANVAVATGAPGPNVLDVDCKGGLPGKRLLALAARAGLTGGGAMLVRTPSGGRHIYYAGTEELGATAGPRRCLELKARGGMVVAPPSVRDGRRYRVLDRKPGAAKEVDFEAIRRLVSPPAPRRAARVAQDAFVDVNVDALARWLRGCPRPGWDGQEMGRNTGLYWACKKALVAGVADLAPLARAAADAGLGDREIAKTVDSARKWHARQGDSS